MKNKYIFLIIALGFGVYFLVRPQIGISGRDMQQAQTVASFDCDSIRNTTLKMICKMKFFILGGSSNTTGGSGNNGINNGGGFVVAPAQTPTTQATPNYKTGFYVMNADGSTEFRPMTFPMQSGPTNSSIYCGFNMLTGRGIYRQCQPGTAGTDRCHC